MQKGPHLVEGRSLSVARSFCESERWGNMKNYEGSVLEQARPSILIMTGIPPHEQNYLLASGDPLTRSICATPSSSALFFSGLRNYGGMIVLRLRTDSLKGFRPYHDLINTLIHEMTHNVHWLRLHLDIFGPLC